MTSSLSGFPNNNPFPPLNPSSQGTPKWLDRFVRAAESLAARGKSTSIPTPRAPTQHASRRS